MTVDRDRVDEVLLDRQLPTYEARQFAATVVDAPAAHLCRPCTGPGPGGQFFPPMRALGWLRAPPARVAGRRQGAASEQDGPIRAWRRRMRSSSSPRMEAEFVVGMVGKFMTPTQLEFRRIEPGDFPTFSEPGYGKVGLNFRVRPYGRTRSLLSTETRTVTTDPHSRDRFRRYWRVVGPFANLIMRRWLRLAKRNAEIAAPGT